MAHEATRLADTAAHLQSMRVELASVNSGIASAKKELDSIQAKIFSAKETLAGILADIKEATKRHSDALFDHKKELDSVSSQIKIAKQNKETIVSESAKENKVHTALVEVASARVKSLEAQATDLHSNILSLISQKTGLEERINVKATELDRLLEEERAGLARRDELVREIALLGEQEVVARKELDDVLAQLDAEQKKVAFPLEALEAREAAVARREQNFEVMYARMDKAFQKMYPGKRLKI